MKDFLLFAFAIFGGAFLIAIILDWLIELFVDWVKSIQIENEITRTERFEKAIKNAFQDQKELNSKAFQNVYSRINEIELKIKQNFEKADENFMHNLVQLKNNLFDLKEESNKRFLILESKPKRKKRR